MSVDRWLVHDVRPAANRYRLGYRFAVAGTHLEDGAPFSWEVPAVDDGYLFTPRAAAQLLGMMP